MFYRQLIEALHAQAESVQAIIDAQTKEAADSALLALRGAATKGCVVEYQVTLFYAGSLSKSVDSVRTACVDLIAELEARCVPEGWV